MADQQDKKLKNPAGAKASPMSETNLPTGRDASSTKAPAGSDSMKNETSFDRAGTPSGGGTAAATARSFYDQAKETAGQAYEAVTDKATTKIEEQKSTLTEGLSTVADTIRQAGDTLGNQQHKTGLTDTAAKYTDTAAQKVEQVARYFEQRDVKEMVRDVESYARRNPAVFIGAAFAAGVLISRFLKAGTPKYGGTGGQNYSGRSMDTENRNTANMNPGSLNAGTSGNVREFGNSQGQQNTPETSDPGVNRF